MNLNGQYYDTTLIKAKARPPAPPPTPRRVVGAGQMLIRAVIGSVLGFRSGDEGYDSPLRHNDPDTEQKLRVLIESLEMSEEYHRLVEFIQKHPDDYVERSK